MFNLPTPPTDSLYKFCFVFGLLLIVYSFYFSDNKLDHFDKKQNYYVIDSLKSLLDTIAPYNGPNNESLNHRRTILQFLPSELYGKIYQLKSLNNHRDYLPGFKKPESIDTLAYRLNFAFDLFKWPETYKINILKRLDKQIVVDKDYYSHSNIDTINTEIQLLSEIYLRLNAEISPITKQLTLLNRQTVEQTYFKNSLLCLGVVLFIFGFIMWLIKIQLPQDKLLKNEIKKIISH